MTPLRAPEERGRLPRLLPQLPLEILDCRHQLELGDDIDEHDQAEPATALF